MRAKRSIEEGFTLTELMAVIAIIGLLTALLLPALSKAKAHSHSALCKNHLRQLGLSLKMYVDDNEGAYPYYLGPADAWDDFAEDNANRSYWWSKLHPYHPVKWVSRSFHCPGYRGVVAARGGNGPLGSYGYNSHGSAIPGGGFIDTQAGINVDYPNVRYGLGMVLYRGAELPKHPPVSEVQIRAPSQMLAIGESRFLSSLANGEGGGEDEMICGIGSRYNGGLGLFPFDPARHGGLYNQVFCDGHVDGMDPKVLFEPRRSAAIWNYDNKPHPELWVPK